MQQEKKINSRVSNIIKSIVVSIAVLLFCYACLWKVNEAFFLKQQRHKVQEAKNKLKIVKINMEIEKLKNSGKSR